MGGEVKRRTFLTALAGTGGFAVATPTTVSTAENHCTPGHDDGDSACRQIYDDRKVLTPFQPDDNRLPVGISYPCGWTTTVSEYEDRIQLNVSRSQIGEDNAYVDIQVRGYYEPVEPGIIEDIKADGDYTEVEYEFAGETRTGLVSSRDTAQYGTLGHAAVPMGESLVHVELVSTMKGTECTLDPRPDWWAVHDMLRTLTTNRESTFIEDSGYLPDYATARIDRERIAYDEAEQRVELPAKPNVTLPGITNLSSESTLVVQANSKQGEDEAWFHLAEGVQIQTAADRDWQLWEIVLEDELVGAEGSEAEIKIRVPGYGANINPGAAIDGIVVDWVELVVFEFTDKTSAGDEIVVDRLETSDGGSIALEDDSGTPLGRKEQLESGTYENLPVSLDEPLTEGTYDVTAKVFQPNGDPYPDDHTRTATITVEPSDSDLPPRFQISNLDPETTQVDTPGETVAVTATIENVGDQTGTQEVSFTVDGSVEETKTVTLEGGERTTVEFDLDTSSLEAGSRGVFSVSTENESVAGSIDVAEAGTSELGTPPADATTTEIGTGVSSEEGPGFDVGGAVVAVLAAMGLAKRYSDSE